MAFEKWRHWAYKRYLGKALKQQRPKRRSTNLESARSVGILFDATDLNDRQEIIEFARSLKNQGKEVKLLGFYRQKQKEENFNFRHFSKKEVNWAWRPIAPEVEEFVARRFDILLTISREALKPLEYISALSKASFRVGGNTSNPECFDLMIEVKQKQHLDYFIKQVAYFLNKMTPRYEAVES